MKNYLLIGQVIKPQGIHGELKVLPATDEPDRFLEIERVFLDEEGINGKDVLSARIREGFVYLQLKGVQDRDEAEKLRGCELFIDRAHAVPLPEGRYYIADLIGMLVTDEKGNELGYLTDVLQAGGNDVYEVVGRRTFRFPALKKVLLQVDVEGSHLTLDSGALSEIAVYDDEN